MYIPVESELVCRTWQGSVIPALDCQSHLISAYISWNTMGMLTDIEKWSLAEISMCQKPHIGALVNTLVELEFTTSIKYQVEGSCFIHPNS